MSLPLTAAVIGALLAWAFYPRAGEAPDPKPPEADAGPGPRWSPAARLGWGLLATVGGVLACCVALIVLPQLMLGATPTPGASTLAPLAALPGLLLVAMPALIYLAPTIVAARRGHPNMAPIVIVNVFLGWTLLGWVVALAWAFAAFEKRS